MPLTLSQVSFSYDRGTDQPVRALSSVDLRVEVGELLLVLGSTGSGKSTLMRLAAGLLQPESGSVEVDGRRADVRMAGSVVGLIFQESESQLFADTLIDDVAFGPRNLGMSVADAHAVAASVLEAVGLEPSAFGQRSPFSLSGGEARRGAIAGVLAMRPRYLLADEPTAGLDAPGRRAVKRLLLEQRSAAGLIVVSHAAEEFLGEADRVVVLVEGRVAWSGSGAEALAEPERLAECGLAVPDVLEVQRRLRACGIPLSHGSVHPEDAARLIVAAGGGA